MFLARDSIQNESTQESAFVLRQFQIVSLWDMLKFYADKFLRIIRLLDLWQDDVTSPVLFKAIEKQADEFQSLLEDMVILVL